MRKVVIEDRIATGDLAICQPETRMKLGGASTDAPSAEAVSLSSRSELGSHRPLQAGPRSPNGRGRRLKPAPAWVRIPSGALSVDCLARPLARADRALAARRRRRSQRMDVSARSSSARRRAIRGC